MIDQHYPRTLLDRFPHLQREISLLAEQDSSFRQLSEDYDLLVKSLDCPEIHTEDDKEDFIKLKTSLEFEALERLSQVKTG